MLKLIYANLNRLFKDKIFYAEMILTAILSVMIVLENYSPEVQASEQRLYLDDVFFNLYLAVGFILAAGISLIVGTEYSDGTIRNKLIVGRTRPQVYFSQLIASAFVPSCLVLLLHGGISYVLGRFLFGNFQMPASQVIAVLMNVFIITLVFSALFTAIAMNCPNKAIIAVVSLLLVLGLTFASSSLGNILDEPEMIYDGIVISMDDIQIGDVIPNPAYVTGTQRSIYEFIYDLLPNGQLLQMFGNDFSRCSRWPVFSGTLLILITGIGFLAFRRRDIK